MTIQEIEEELKSGVEHSGQLHPGRLALMKDYLAATSSAEMDRQLYLQAAYAKFYQKERENYKSDKGVLQAWRLTEEGMEELVLDKVQRQIKILREAISSHLRVADNQARNLY